VSLNTGKWFKKVGATPIIPLSVRIMLAFVVLLLLSTFSTNYLNLALNQRELVRKTNELLVRELKELYTFASNQYDIYEFSKDRAGALSSVAASSEANLKFRHSAAFGLGTDGSLLFLATNGERFSAFADSDALARMESARLEGKSEGAIRYSGEGGGYFGVYKYLDKWNCYIVRAELYSDMTRGPRRIFILVCAIIVLLTGAFVVIGLVCINHILRFLRRLSDGMLQMQADQNLRIIDLSGAPNDDVTYLGASFNALSATINNLMTIFRKFVTQDVVERAYQEHQIRLEGKQMDLSILFSDIRGFTYMTETLGNDIIDLLNVHYDRAIKCIHTRKGIVGSIIGDAVLAVYGTLRDSTNKSLEAIESAYEIQKVTAALRGEMQRRREEIEKTRPLTEAEERVFLAVLIDVGVGIDGGNVFYGNIGSQERMTNTVIGDNVNSASRLEGLTRIYHLPVICSEYIRDEVTRVTGRYRFVEIDTVLVKGKTEGKRIFFPLDTESATSEEAAKYDLYEAALAKYYEGDWSAARESFRKCGLESSEVFFERTGKTARAGEGWRGIWTMTTK